MKYLRLFLAPDDDGGGAQPPVPEPKPEPATEPEPLKTLTQDEVNKLIATEKRNAQAKILKELGIEGDDLTSTKEALKKYKEQQDAEKSEAEKLKEALDAKEASEQTAKQEALMARAELEAIKAGCPPDDAGALVKLALDEEGENIADKIKSVMEKHPTWFKASKLDKFGNPVKNENKSDEDAILEQFRKGLQGKA